MRALLGSKPLVDMTHQSCEKNALLRSQMDCTSGLDPRETLVHIVVRTLHGSWATCIIMVCTILFLSLKKIISISPCHCNLCVHVLCACVCIICLTLKNLPEALIVLYEKSKQVI